MRIWVDTDIGDNPDDAVALLCAVAHPHVELVGISTVDGDHPRRLARVAALTQSVAVPGDDPDLPEIVHAAQPDALLAIGPLTNVAAIVAATGGRPTITVMGGVVEPVSHRGAVRGVEHNFARDPIAAQTVLATAAPVLVSPLDVTVALCLTSDQQDELDHAAPQLAADVTAWLDRLAADGVPADQQRVCLHDPVALLALTDPTLVRVEHRRLRVDHDGRLVDDPEAAEQHVVRFVDAGSAFARILDLLRSA